MEIEKTLGFANANIIACCRSKLVTAYGYHWLYLEDFQSNNHIIKKDKRKRKIYCITLETEFESLAEAARATRTNSSNISACCAGRLKSAGGYKWRYAE